MKQFAMITMSTLPDDLREAAEKVNDHFIENGVPTLSDYGYEKALSCRIRKGIGDIVRDLETLASKVECNNSLMHGVFEILKEEDKS